MIHDADPRPAMVCQKAGGSLPLDELLAQKQKPSAQTNIQGFTDSHLDKFYLFIGAQRRDAL